MYDNLKDGIKKKEEKRNDLGIEFWSKIFFVIYDFLF